MIITVSREKIAHELIRLRNENAELRAQSGNPSQISRGTDYQSKLNGETRKSNNAAPFGVNRQPKSMYYSGS